MSNIYSAKFMLEASTTLESKVFKRSVNETYLFSAMKALHEMNAIIDDKTKELYIQISEAESKEDENKLFAEYFYQFKAIFSEFSNRMQQLKSRMTIAIENKVETWEELFKDDSYISNFDKQFSFSGYNFPHIEESDYPRLNLYKIYQKEFDFIGQLMQDTSMNASPSVRLKIIASVCNNFAGAARDKNWIKNLIQDMVDIDEKEITRSYSECIYNALRDKYDINVDKGMLYTCKENLSDYEDVIDAASRLCDNLLYELDKVAENIASFLFRNKDKKLVIKTDTDGIIDRDYRLDTYSMNQLDLFMKNKISQMKKVLNVFGVAIGIKFDTAVEYIEQQIEILKMAKTYDCNKVEADEEENKPSVEEPEDGNETPEGEEPEEDNDDDDDDDKPEDGNDDDFKFGDEDDDDNKESIEEDDEFGSFDDESKEEPPQSSEIVDNDKDGFDEAYLFEAELHELELMHEEYEMHRFITEALVLEGDPPPAGSGGGDSGGSTSTQTGSSSTQGTTTGDSGGKQEETKEKTNVEKLANKAPDLNFIQKIIAKIKELWEKFKKKFFDRSKEKIEYLKRNKKYIFEHTVTAKCKLKYTPNLTAFSKIGSLPDLDYTSANMQEALNSENDFIEKYFKEFFQGDAKDASTLTDAIKITILGKEMEDEVPANTINNPDVKGAYTFCCSGYEKFMNGLTKMMNTLNKAERAAKDNISRVAGKTIDEAYFLELDSSEKKPEKDSTKSDRVKVYFNVTTRAVAAYMTVASNMFDEMYAFCKFWIGHAKGGNAAPASEKKDGEKTTEEKTA